MKPGMQRDLLVAFWLLFDEFVVEEDLKDAAARAAEAERQAATKAGDDPKK
jgi:hypothetical protein